MSRYPLQQKSDIMTLRKDGLYYIEADMLEENGDDHLEVGVQLPNGEKLMPIPRRMLRTGFFFCIVLNVFVLDTYGEHASYSLVAWVRMKANSSLIL